MCAKNAMLVLTLTKNKLLDDGHRGRKWSERGWVFKGEEGTKKKDFLRDKFGKREKQKR